MELAIDKWSDGARQHVRAVAAHPSREDWANRQSHLPEGARQLLARIEAKKAVARNESDIIAARNAAEAAEWRQQFEAALAGVLVANGCEWLNAYRVPDHECAALPEFTGSARLFWGLYDPRAVGLWPIAVRLEAGDGIGRAWRPILAPWRVCRPSGDLSYREFLVALEFAAQHTTPF